MSSAVLDSGPLAHLSELNALNQNSTLYIRLSLLQDVIQRVEEEWFPR